MAFIAGHRTTEHDPLLLFHSPKGATKLTLRAKRNNKLQCAPGLFSSGNPLCLPAVALPFSNPLLIYASDLCQA